MITSIIAYNCTLEIFPHYTFYTDTKVSIFYIVYLWKCLCNCDHFEYFYILNLVLELKVVYTPLL